MLLAGTPRAADCRPRYRQGSQTELLLLLRVSAELVWVHRLRSDPVPPSILQLLSCQLLHIRGSHQQGLAVHNRRAGSHADQRALRLGLLSQLHSGKRARQQPVLGCHASLGYCCGSPEPLRIQRAANVLALHRPHTKLAGLCHHPKRSCNPRAGHSMCDLMCQRRAGPDRPAFGTEVLLWSCARGACSTTVSSIAYVFSPVPLDVRSEVLVRQ